MRKFTASEITYDHACDIARGAIERHLGDVLGEEHTADMIYDEAFAIAHDALVDAGVLPGLASLVAQVEAQKIAQP